MDTLLKFFLFLVFGPVLLGMALQLTVAVLQVLLPWLILLALIAGVAAGLSAGFSMRRRIPPHHRGAPLQRANPRLIPYRVRRPRAGARR